MCASLRIKEDPHQQVAVREPVVLTGPVARPPALPREVVSEIAAIRTRAELLRSKVYRRHERALLDATYAFEHRPAARPRPTAPRGFIRVVSWNIQRGIHLDGIAAFLENHPELRHADVLLLNEVDVGMARSGNRHVAAELADRLGFGYVFGNSYVCLDFGDPRDGTPAGHNQESLHGNAILSRFPLCRAECFSIAITKDKLHSSEKRLGHKKALWAEVETPLGPLPVVAVHLDSSASAAQRGEQIADVLDKLTQRGLGDRFLVGGDLNTTTYDAGNVGQIALNLARKLVRGGFPHAIHAYLYPYEIYERPIFDRLAAAGLDFRPFNAPAVGTTRYEVGSFESESKVSERLPRLAVTILRHKLKPWGGVAALKVDWFFGRGLRVLQGPGGSAKATVRPVSPTPIRPPPVGGVPLSDHDPILVDVAPANGAP